jgi:hypothetical protein
MLGWRQVVMPEDPPFEAEYDDLRRRLFAKYRQPVPDEFSQVRGGGAAAAAEGAEGGAQAGYSAASRTTEADEAQDATSLRRALDKRLFLLIRAAGGAAGDSSLRTCNPANAPPDWSVHACMHACMARAAAPCTGL